MNKDCRICVHNKEDVRVIDYYQFNINSEMVDFYLKNNKDSHVKYEENKGYIISQISQSFGICSDLGGHMFGYDYFELGYYLNETQEDRIKSDLDEFTTFFSGCTNVYLPMFHRREVRTTKAYIADVG